MLLTLVTKARLWIAAGLMAAGVYVGFWVSRLAHDDVDAVNEILYRRQVQINDSTSVVMAGKDAKLRELEGLVTASRQVNGRLVAGVKAHLEIDASRGVDTLVVWREPVAGAARTYAFSDTSWRVKVTEKGDTLRFPLGVLVGNLTVATGEAPLLEWEYDPSPVEPSVGFVKLGGRYLAVVTCDVCSDVRVEAPFVDPKQFAPRVPRVSKWVGGQWNLVDRGWTARAGVDLRLVGGVSVGAEGRRVLRPGEESQLLLGFLKRF